MEKPPTPPKQEMILTEIELNEQIDRVQPGDTLDGFLIIALPNGDLYVMEGLKADAAEDQDNACRLIPIRKYLETHPGAVWLPGPNNSSPENRVSMPIASQETIDKALSCPVLISVESEKIIVFGGVVQGEDLTFILTKNDQINLKDKGTVTIKLLGGALLSGRYSDPTVGLRIQDGFVRIKNLDQTNKKISCEGYLSPQEIDELILQTKSLNEALVLLSLAAANTREAKKIEVAALARMFNQIPEEITSKSGEKIKIKQIILGLVPGDTTIINRQTQKENLSQQIQAYQKRLANPGLSDNLRKKITEIMKLTEDQLKRLEKENK